MPATPLKLQIPTHILKRKIEEYLAEAEAKYIKDKKEFDKKQIERRKKFAAKLKQLAIAIEKGDRIPSSSYNLWQEFDDIDCPQMPTDSHLAKIKNDLGLVTATSQETILVVANSELARYL